MGDIFCDKRTRSQLTLPDDIYQHLPLSRSPLKDARTALRNQSEPPVPSWLNESVEDESEDEILLSPTKAKSVKRSASPSRDANYSSNTAVPSEFPVFKRLRRDDGAAGHIDSENVNMPSSPSRHFVELSLESPKRVGDGSPRKAGLIPSRARSVPPTFPSINLRNPPSSPNKPRSPRKVTPMLKITVVAPPEKLEPILDEETEQEGDGQHAVSSLNLVEQGIVTGEVPEPPQPPEDPHNVVVVNAHKTPARTRLIAGPLSPLTPLPETPIAPPQLHDDLKDRILNTSGWGFERNSNVSVNTDVHPESLHASHLPAEAAVRHSRISRPSLASENVLATPVADPSPSSLTAPPAQGTTTSVSVKSHAKVVSQKRNLFDIMMRASQSSTVKGKGKAPASLAAHSVSKSADKGKSEEQRALPKQSVKNRMRPKEVPQPRREAIPNTDIQADGEGEAGPSGSRPPLIAERGSEPHSETQEGMNSDLEELFDETKATLKPEAEAVIDDPTSESANHKSLPITAVSDEGQNVVEASKPPMPATTKKRARIQASSIPRVTRSSSLKKKEQDAERASQDPRVRKRSLLGPKSSPKSVSKPAHTSAPAEPANRERSTSPLTDLSSDSVTELSGQPTDASDTPKTPRLSNNFARPTLSSLAKTPAWKTPVKTTVNLSPTKLGRSASMFARPIGGIMPSKPTNGSALSNLSSALEKLAVPPPSRPTSDFGFNSDNEGSSTSSHRTGPLPRSAILGSAEISVASSSKSTPATSLLSKPILEQRPVTDFFKKDALKRPSRLMSGTAGFHRGKPGIFPYRVAQKVSQKTPLPVVPASPVKGNGDGDGDDDMMTSIEQKCDSAKSRWESKVVASTPEAMELSELVGAHLVKGKRKATDEADGWGKNASRRASMAFNMLSQSMPPPASPNTSGNMGPPATPPKREGLRSSTASHPAPSSVASSSAARKPNGLGPKRTPSTNDVSDEEVGHDDKSYSYSGRKVSGSKKPPDPSLNILSGIKVYVDIRDSNGIDCGDVFIDMLKRLGAKVMKNFGLTCTHLVFKDGTVSTLNRYRQLETKPFVVGLQWIVECAEQRLHLDETKYAISLEDINIAGVNKRARKSMIPKPIASTHIDDPFSDPLVTDSSVDESNSSFSIDSSLKPLERARRRQSTMVTSRS